MQPRKTAVQLAHQRTQKAINDFLAAGNSIKKLANGESAYNDLSAGKRGPNRRPHNSALTEPQVVEIRKQLARDMPKMERIVLKHKLAKEYSVSYKTIWRIDVEQIWKGVR